MSLRDRRCLSPLSVRGVSSVGDVAFNLLLAFKVDLNVLEIIASEFKLIVRYHSHGPSTESTPGSTQDATSSSSYE